MSKEYKGAALPFTLCILFSFFCRRCPVPSGEHSPLGSSFCLTGQVHLHPLHGVSIHHSQHLLLLLPCCAAGQVVGGVWRCGDADLGGEGWKGEGQRGIQIPGRIAQLHVFLWWPVTVAWRFALQWLGSLSLRGAARPGGRQWPRTTQGQR